MNSVINHLHKNSSKYWNAFQIAILTGIFFYYFAENFILSESWEVLSLRSVDDYAINSSMHQMQKAIVSRNWGRAITFFDYAYGNAFWWFNSILLMPLYAMGDAQISIITGRQISLLYVFGSIYLIGLIIDKLRPDATYLKYPILIAVATMPMIAIIGTKFHVNAQSQFFGILSFFLLIRQPHITQKDITWSGIFGGIAVGLKLTGIFILPLLGLTLISRLVEKNNSDVFKCTVRFCIICILTAAACIAPLLLLAFTQPLLTLLPYFANKLKSTYTIFLQYKNMGSADNFSLSTLIIDGMGFYLSQIALFLSIFFFIPLIFSDIKKRKFISLFILFSLVLTEIFLLLTVNKGPVYMAAYFVNLGFLIPIGLLGLATLSIPKILKIAVAYLITLSPIYFNLGFRHDILSEFNFFNIAKSKNIQNHLHALNEIKSLITPIKLPVHVLQDSTSVFPATNLTDGVYAVYIYDNLKDYSAKGWGRFDYISLNSKEYFKKISPTPTPKELADNALEEAIRKTLYTTGIFYGYKYQLIYDGYDTLLYKLVPNNP